MRVAGAKKEGRSPVATSPPLDGEKMSFYCRKLLHRVASPVVALAQRRLSNAGGRLTAHNGKRARMPIVESSRSANAAGVSRARVDCRRPSRPSGIGECPDRSLASPQVDQAPPFDLRPLQTESAVARKSLAQNVAVAKSGSFQARQLSHAALPSATLIGHGQSPQTRRRARGVFRKVPERLAEKS